MTFYIVHKDGKKPRWLDDLPKANKAAEKAVVRGGQAFVYKVDIALSKRGVVKALNGRFAGEVVSVWGEPAGRG